MEISATEIEFGKHRFQRTAVHGYILRNDHILALIGDDRLQVDLGFLPKGWPFVKSFKPLLHNEYLFFPEHVLGYHKMRYQETRQFGPQLVCSSSRKSSI